MYFHKICQKFSHLQKTEQSIYQNWVLVKDFAEYVKEAVVADENAFSRACAAGGNISPYLKRAYICDLTEIGRALEFSSPDFYMGKPSAPLMSWDEKASGILGGIGEIRIRISGSGFLYHMVRIICGTVIEVGTGARRVSDIQEILDARDRKKAGMTAGPEGLILCSIEYPEDQQGSGNR